MAEYGGALHRLLSVLKMRFSDYDRTIHEYTITPGEGIALVGPAPPAEGLLTGLARLVTPSGAGAPSGGVAPSGAATWAGRQA